MSRSLRSQAHQSGLGGVGGREGLPGGGDWQSSGSVKGRDLSPEVLSRLLLAVSLGESHRTL